MILALGLILQNKNKRLSSLRANVIRLRAELSSILIGSSEAWQRQIDINIKEPVFPEDLAAECKLYGGKATGRVFWTVSLILINQLAIQGQQIQQREQEVAELDSKINTLEISYQIANKELDLTRPLAEKNIVSKIELYKLERSVNELKR